ncbi:M10 family metallopeptidase [Cribrihabitans neustonicus]|uniref:M10 family metallopeptidase n=1 Tax=Cribrihabitans neustonicus TaxID=1429085 RepID=UPI003B5A2478
MNDHAGCSPLSQFNEKAAAALLETADAAAGPWTSYDLGSGGSCRGALSRPGDRDWVGITLEAGATYSFTLKGSASGHGSLGDPLLRLHDSSGRELRMDDDSGTGLNSEMTFTAPASGTYYLAAGSFADHSTGSYLLETTRQAPPQPATLNQLADYLTDGYWRDHGLRSHSFETSRDNVITVDVTGLTAEGRQLARWAFEAWEMAADIEFRETGSGADITFDDNGSGAYSNSDAYNGRTVRAFVNVSLSWLEHFGTSPDSYSYQVYLHEIGHALGLGHQGNYNGSATFGIDNEFANDSWQLSVMSYFSQNENTLTDASEALLLTPMMADVIAIQNLYGAPDTDSATAGNTVWGPGTRLPGVLGDLFNDQNHYRGYDVAFTIYDRSGTDTLDVSGFSAGSRIDLRGGHFSDIDGLTGNVGIARGTVVENTLTGSGNDTVTGNAADNIIRGGGGSDRLRGHGGEDLLAGGGGGDRLFGHNGDDRLRGHNGEDELRGGSGRDALAGGGGDDRLDGGRGNDRLTGGSGADVFVFTAGHGRDVVRDFSTAQGDRLDFSGLDGFGGFASILAEAQDSSAGLRIVTGADSAVLLKGVSLESLAADDFLF